MPDTSGILIPSIFDSIEAIDSAFVLIPEISTPEPSIACSLVLNYPHA